jgi:hypothetical protein
MSLASDQENDASDSATSFESDCAVSPCGTIFNACSYVKNYSRESSSSSGDEDRGDGSDGDFDEDTKTTATRLASLSANAAFRYRSDDSAAFIDDANEATLSSVFGRPLLSNPPQQSSLRAPEPNSDSCIPKCVGDEQPEIRQSALYSLACIHQRIMTLEEHSSRVKSLETVIAEKDRLIEELRERLNSRLETTCYSDGRAHKRPRLVSMGE